MPYPSRAAASVLVMAREPIPVASLIASGQINRVTQSINALKLFPDYSKLYAAALPDMAPVLQAVKLPDLSGVVAASLQDRTKMFDTSRMLSAALPDYSKLYASLNTTKIISDATRMATAAQLAEVSKLVSSMALKSAFPDYSKLFTGLDTASVFRDYAAAMPAAARVAETYVAEEVLPAVEEFDSHTGESVGRRLEQLSPEQRRRVREQLEKAIIAVLGITGYATKESVIILAGPGLALASAFLVLWFILCSNGDEED